MIGTPTRMPWTASLTSPCNPDRIVSQPVGTFPCRPVFFCPLSTISLTLASPPGQSVGNSNCLPDSPPTLLTFDNSCLFKGGHPVGLCSPVGRRFQFHFVFFFASQTSYMLIRLSTVQRAKLCVLKAGL